MFTLAHLSDLHLQLAKKPRIWKLLNKRLIGYLNLSQIRNKQHADHVLDAIVADIHAHTPDHVAVTGDLVNLALPDEYETASRWLQQLGAGDTISLVPGNHDAYVRKDSQDGIPKWAPYMQDDDLSITAPYWPYVRRRGSVALIGVNAAIPSRPWMATGHVGQEQRDRIPALLQQLREEKLFRIMLIHYPPVPYTTKWHKRLTDAGKLTQIIRTHGVELILHGHNHTDTILCLSGSKEGPIPVIGVPSASSLGYRNHPPGQYNLFSISGNYGAWRCKLTVRGLCLRTNNIRTLYEKTFSTTS